MSELGHYALTGTGLDIIYWIFGIIFALIVYIFLMNLAEGTNLFKDLEFNKKYWAIILYILPLAFSFGLCIESGFLVVECSLEVYYFTRELFSDILLNLGIIISCIYVILGSFGFGLIKINIKE